MPDKQRKSNDDTTSSRHARHVSGPRPFWSGTITFGLVSLPVGLYPANRSKPAVLHMVDQDGTRLTRRYFCEKEKRVLVDADLVRGYELEKDRFVVVDDEELEALAPDKSQEIDLQRFVALADIDPLYFERAYFLTPEQGVTKAYRLLAKSMEEAGRAGIATFVMRGREYLAAIIAESGILCAETLRFHDEIRTAEDIVTLERRNPPKARVTEVIRAIDKLTTQKLDHSELEDQQSLKLLEHIQAKLKKDQDVIIAPKPPDDDQGGEVVDLMQVLKQSLAEGRSPVDESKIDSIADAKKSSQRGSSASRKAKRGKVNHKQGKTGSGAKGHSGKIAKHASDGRDLESLSRDELYERARDLGIAGRSRMNKRQLATSIMDAS